MFNILSEEKILFATDAFGNLGNITLCKGNRLTAKDLNYIDILLIRSGTRVDHALLAGTPVQFVASATVGTDHVDKAYLVSRNVPFYHAPACNAESVVEYVLAALYEVAARQKTTLKGKTVGIVGAGSIGGRLAKRLPALGMQILVNDPPQFGNKPGHTHPFPVVSLDTLLAQSDIVTTHTPLTKTGAHATHHLLDKARLLQMKPDAWLVNAARGAIVSNEALKSVLKAGHLGAVILDVWEYEPEIDTELLSLVDIGTPHIAGHSYEGKVNGTIQIYEAFTAHYGVDGGWEPASILQPTAEDQLLLEMPAVPVDDEAWMLNVIRQMYDIRADDAAFRALLSLPKVEQGAFFLASRKGYPRRRTFRLHHFDASAALPEVARRRLEKGLYMQP
ncbi:MAG: 4-phosphoerythronate dehydrogenase [Bacteroidota bacterium]